MSAVQLQDETTDLKLHAHLCAERYEGIQEKFENLEKRLDRVENKVDDIRDEINEGNKSMKTTMIGAAVSIIVALLGVVGTILTQI